MTSPHQDARVEDLLRDGARELVKVVRGALPAVVRPFIPTARVEAAVVDGLRELLDLLGVTPHITVRLAQGAKINVTLKRGTS